MAGRSTGGADDDRSRPAPSRRASPRSADSRPAGSRPRARLTPPRDDDRPTLTTSPRTASAAGDGRHRFELVRELGPVAVVLALAVVVLAGLAVLPARTWWTQRQNLNQARAELAQMEQDVSDLKAHEALLQTDAEVERLARQDYDLVYPGEESYRLVPPDAVQSGAAATPANGSATP